MPGLRWSLLIAGLLLIGGLLGWEMLKRRLVARRGAGTEVAKPAGGTGPAGGTDAATADGRGSRVEPVFSVPDLPGREAVRSTPMLEIVDPAVFDEVEAGAAQTGPILAHDTAPADPVGRAEAWISADSAAIEPPLRLVIEWPAEDSRRIVTLRIAPRPGEKFTGAALRQALSGEGFVHGEMDIFHKPLGDGRVVMSAASLTRPGTFQLATMDTQLYGGLSLFAVLPGPLPQRETVDRLCLVARTLGQRLRGQVHDDAGRPLTDARIAELRREVTAVAAAGGDAPTGGAAAGGAPG